MVDDDVDRDREKSIDNSTAVEPVGKAEALLLLTANRGNFVLSPGDKSTFDTRRLFEEVASY